MVLDGKASHEYPINAGVSQGSIFGLTYFLQCINDLPGYFISNIAMQMILLSTKCDQASDLR